MKKKIVSVTLLSLGLSAFSFADEWRLGIAGGAQSQTYKGVKRDFTVHPLIHYDSDRFYFQGDGAGIYFLKTDEHRLSLGAQYDWSSFKPKDSKDWQMKMLKKRKSSVMVNLDYTYVTPYGELNAEFNVDVLRKSKGITLDLGYTKMIEVGDVTFVPNVGVTWYSSRYNNYYYGISEGEAQRSGLAHYKSKSGVNPYAELNVIYKPAKQWELLMTGRYEHLSSQVKNSPMVNKKGSSLFKVGVSYLF